MNKVERLGLAMFLWVILLEIINPFTGFKYWFPWAVGWIAFIMLNWRNDDDKKDEK